MNERKQFINITLNEAGDLSDRKGIVVLPMSVPIGMEASIRIAGEKFQNVVSYYRDRYDGALSEIPKGGYFAMAGLYLSYKYLESEKNNCYDNLLSRLKDLNTKVESILFEKD